MTSIEEKNIQTWNAVIDADNKGDWARKQTFFHPDFFYDNPSRPDLRNYEAWNKAAMDLYDAFAPIEYTVKDAVAEGDEVWVYCGQRGKHSGARFMGLEPSGKDFYVEWFSIVTFKDGKIIRIFSIDDMIGLLLQLGALGPNYDPSDPHAPTKGFKALT